MPKAEFALLGPECYRSAEWLARERVGVFEANWHFAGFRDELNKPGDYVTLQVGGVDVIVRRGNSQIMAFRNVCSHRHARILNDSAGSGPLRCGYHAWTYDDDGYPVGLPACSDDFGLSESERKGLSLEPFTIDCVGPFVFVLVGIQSVSLRDYLGELAHVFDEWTGSFCPPFERGESTWDANWKSGIENSLESYHAPIVHAKTLATVVSLKYENRIYGNHSSTIHPLRDSCVEWWVKINRQTGIKPVPASADYRHYFVYPNVGISLTYGTVLSVQRFEPNGVDEFKHRYWMCTPKNTDSHEPTVAALQSYISEFNQTVIGEDRMQVQSCRHGLTQARRPALLGCSESRILGFQRALCRDIETATA